MKLSAVRFVFFGLVAAAIAGCTPTTSQLRAEADAEQMQRLQMQLQREARTNSELLMRIEELEERATLSKEALEIQDKQKKEADQARKQINAKLQAAVQGMPCEVSLQRDQCVLTTRFSFEPGSTELTPQARSDLRKVAAEVLKQFPNAGFLVAGHADNTAITQANFKSNWELSAARALSVMEFLIADQKVPPQKIAFAGYGEFRPVADNGTPEGREKNRRIEIIVTPQ